MFRIIIRKALQRFVKLFWHNILNNVRIDVVDYGNYEWIDEPVIDKGIILASAKDIAALKINAIEGRGTKKDFVDLNELLKHFELSEIIDFYMQKYPDYSLFQALLSLTYFDDAESQAMPVMLVADTWEDMKEKIREEVRKYQKNN